MGVGRDEVIVLGAGFAGLGTAAMLKRRGIDARVIERSSQVGASWRGRYESLRLNTLRWMSTLHGYRMPRSYGRWPTRDQVVAYLEEYVRRMGVDVTYETEARRIERSDGGWRVATSGGDLDAQFVVVATGYDHDSVIPDWPGRETFPGELVHAAEYRNPEPYRGRDVLVVSCGNTGSEVACELARNGAARVRSAMRSSPNIVTREVYRVPTPLLGFGLDYLPTRIADPMANSMQRMVYGDLTEYGIPKPSFGLKMNVLERHVAPVVDAGFISHVKRGDIEIVAAVAAFEGPDVILADGSRIQPEAVIAATGYRRGLEPLVGHLPVLDELGEPTHNGVPACPETPGLYFIGYRTWIRGQLPMISRDSRRIARAVASSARRRRGGAADAAPTPLPA